MELPVVNHKDYEAHLNDDNKFPIKKFGELAKALIKNKIVKNFFIPEPCSVETLTEAHTEDYINKIKNKDGIIKGGYLFKDNSNDKININLLGSGPIFRECIEASKILKDEYGIGSRLYSITSYSELEKNAKSVLRQNTLSPANKKQNY